jgi:hypothetical protein
MYWEKEFTITNLKGWSTYPSTLKNKDNQK